MALEVRIQASFKEKENLKADFRENDNLNANFGETSFIHTENYDDLYNKPQIEGVVLQGNKTFPELGLGNMTDQEIDKIIYGG